MASCGEALVCGGWIQVGRMRLQEGFIIEFIFIFLSISISKTLS